EFESRFPLQILQTTGRVAEWLCSGLQIRVRRFNSDPGLHIGTAKCRPRGVGIFFVPMLLASTWNRVNIHPTDRGVGPHNTGELMTSRASAAMRPLACSVSVILGLAFSLPALAQDTPTTLPGQTPQDIDPASRTPAVEPARIDLGTLAVSADCPFAGKGEITLRRIEVAGATLVPQAA